MKHNTKEACAGYAVKATQGIVVAVIMPVMFMVGIVCAGVVATCIVGEASVKTAKKIKNRVLWK